MDALPFFLFVLLWWSRIHESTGMFIVSAEQGEQGSGKSARAPTGGPGARVDAGLPAAALLPAAPGLRKPPRLGKHKVEHH
ncbi:hypothetical protein D4764_17G0009280 [Takifugu flavidus]|uniref:Secreted protein n=1 Tax=Takifugu flavidus TaxID=433684 RepID=A0A5C6NWV4_9TELE|nr:hypothetical protein D4764_17G0009280 [Takifugu flavidus]